MNDMIMLLASRRSVRTFKKTPLERETIDTLLSVALLSPSSRDRRPWEFITVTDPDILIKLSAAKEHSASFIRNAPLAIVVIANPSVCDVWIEDCSITMILMQLSAQTLGLGSCWVQIRERYAKDGSRSDDCVKNILGIPEEYQVLSILAVGHPDEEKKPYDLKKLTYRKIHNERF